MSIIHAKLLFDFIVQKGIPVSRHRLVIAVEWRERVSGGAEVQIVSLQSQFHYVRRKCMSCRHAHLPQLDGPFACPTGP